MSASIPADLATILRGIPEVAVLTGAGISAESGIPTFREARTGLWAKYDPAELATPDAFLRNPKLVWEWYAWRRGIVASARPNPGHLALAEMEKQLPRFTLITQNVDGLHRRAGSQNILELHGSIQKTLCFRENVAVERWEETNSVPPKCPNCGGPLRPGVVWFGESLPIEVLNAATRAVERCSLLLVVGTSTLVYPAASLPFLALDRGVSVAEINPDRTPLSAGATWSLRGKAGVLLPALIRAAWPEAQDPAPMDGSR